MKLYVTRHGQVCPNDFTKSVDFPTGDIPLSEKGQAQAACLGEELKKRNFKGIIISSPYRRTMMTANIAAEICGAPIYPDGALRELFFEKEAAEAFIGMDLSALRALFPCIAEDATLPHPWWTKTPDSNPILVERLRKFWTPILSSGHSEVLAVGHGASVFGSMHFLNTTFGLGMPTDLSLLADFLATRNVNCNLSCVETDDSGKMLSARMFATTHIPDELITSNTNARPRPAEICF